MPKHNCHFIEHEKQQVSLTPTGEHFREKLRKYFQSQVEQSGYYASVFQKLGLDVTCDPLDVLGELPATTKEIYRETLQLESMTRLNERTFVTDFSSGSTADSVLRLCAPTDDLAEQAVTEGVFCSVGMGPDDHFVCMDIGAPDIYDFYFRAARNLGVPRCSFLHLGSEYATACRPLIQLRPSIFLTVPSLMIRAWPVIGNYWSTKDCPIKTVIHMGEPMHDTFRKEVESTWGCAVRSFYGTTETGGMGIDCSEKDGIHFEPRAFLATLEKAEQVDKNEFEGEVLFTTLHVRTQSVIKYRVGDRVRLTAAPCSCGNTMPRLKFIERTHEAFMIAGEKFSHSMILEGLQESAPNLPLANLIIEDLAAAEGDALLRVQLPDTYREQESEFLETLQTSIFELDALYHYGHVKFELEFLPIEQIQGRKIAKVRDHRLHMSHTAESGSTES